MDIESMIAGLARPDAYPHPADSVEIRQTHISVVALAGEHVYKVKKSVDLGFLDFTTLEKRLHFCREEVRLNRRLAPDVYLGVVPLVLRGGRIVVGGEGQALEYAVEMRRLPENATLRARVMHDEVEQDTFAALGRRIASFHRAAESGRDISEFGRWSVVAGNARENLAQARPHVGTTLGAPVLARLERALEQRLRSLRETIESRAEAGVPRDTHGDLHLDHVYFFPEAPPPRDFVIIDCVEFNERFRYADPVADVAFLVMDLLHHGRWDLAEPFLEEYFHATGDVEGRRLLAFYVAYRAAVRAKVGGMLAAEKEVPEAQRAAAVRRAGAHWLLALSELEGPANRPGLVLVGGLPGTGKTTLATDLAEEAGFTVISTDRTRKELAGLDADTPAASDFGTGLYTPEWNDRTYAACLDRAKAILMEGGRVVVDGSFREAERRRSFRDAAVASGVRSIFLVCAADADVVRTRLRARRGGPSDADWSTHEAAARVWEQGHYHDPRWERTVQTAGTRADALEAALDHLRAVGLAAAGRR
jgi:aminoglycoside phosphotransferase family enzyme/predicted kinase